MTASRVSLVVYCTEVDKWTRTQCSWRMFMTWVDPSDYSVPGQAMDVTINLRPRRLTPVPELPPMQEWVAEVSSPNNRQQQSHQSLAKET